MYNDLLLPLDEMGEINPKEAGEIAYMLGNGTGKARADKTGGARDKAKFRCLFLSTGEVSLAQHMLEDGKKAKAGQETRIADIPADLGNLAARAKEIFESSEVDEKRQLLNFVFQNLKLDGKNLSIETCELFTTLVDYKKCPKGWGNLDLNQGPAGYESVDLPLKSVKEST